MIAADDPVLTSSLLYLDGISVSFDGSWGFSESIALN